MAHPSHLKNQHNNHPRQGSCITVDPIYDPNDIQTIKNMLMGKPRDYLLFVMGINSGLRAGDLLKLRAESFKNAQIGDKIRIKEQKRGKIREIVVNEAVKEALDKYFRHYSDDDNYLFASKKCKNKPITVECANRLVKSWCKQAELTGNYGSHTLRKTWGTMMRIKGNGWELISKAYNHSDPKVTMRYIGVQDSDVSDMIMKCPI